MTTCTANRTAQEAYARARAMGWEAWAVYDQSDVLDMATVVARHPITGLYRVARWIEGDLNFTGWLQSRRDAMGHLDYSSAYDC